MDRLTNTVQTFLPTILLSTLNPTLSTLLTRLADKLTKLENYETVDGRSPSPRFWTVADRSYF